MLYAKSSPRETIWEHTELLLKGLELLRESYGHKVLVDDDFWRLLHLAAHLHDFGKANLLFQNKIRRVLGEPELPCSLPHEEEIPHNYVSVAFLPYTQLQLTKEQWQLLVYAIGYHHERKNKPDRKRIQQFMQAAIPHHIVEELFNQMQWSYAPEKPNNSLLNILEKREEKSRSIQEDREFFRRYVLLKGFLHRLDHAASAHVEVEKGIHEHAGEKVKRFIKKESSLRPAQQFAENHRDQNVIVVASTGSGKTEASLLWADQDKTFITLPLRVSLNAMYERLKNENNVGLNNLGLLHSGSFEYLFEKDSLDAEESYRVSRELSQKVTLSTIDQILKFPFLHRGFEKELATMAYSKLVIDEIQAYDPNIAAMLIKALEMVAEIGGKFMVMTATMPQLYLEEIQRRMANLGAPLAYGEFPNDDLLRHRVTLCNQSVLDNIDRILQSGRSKKVLVICNTVDRAIEVYEKLKEARKSANLNIPIRLLHARFMQKHKMALEQMITCFAKSGWHTQNQESEPGIWVTTQVVEASVDVDFDELFTEICTLDSLFQRMGRCYRVRPYSSHEPNIYVLTADASGIGSVYDKQLTANSISTLAPYDGQLLTESRKMAMVRQLYSRDQLSGSPFLKKFEEALSLFDNMAMFELSSADSQKLLREIVSKELIPPRYWATALDLADRFAVEKDVKSRQKLRRELEKLTVSLNERSLERRKIAYGSMPVRGLEYLHWVSDADVEYDFDETKIEGAGLKYCKSVNMY